jgi:hypothetical protein
MDYVDDLMRTGSGIDAEIAKFVLGGMGKQILGTSRALQDYMAIIGMRSDFKTRDRYQHIKQIAEFLRSVPKDEVMEKIRAAQDLGEGGSALQRWTDIIVKSDDRQQ